MKINIYPEACCDYCGDIIHNHIACPACGRVYAGSSVYGDMHDLDIGESMLCEECKAGWKLISKGKSDGWVSPDDFEWEPLPKGSA